MIEITIQEVANQYGLTKDTLRYYEKEGLIGPIKKNRSGIREYVKEDLERIEFVKCMRNAGLSIAVLKEYMKLYDMGYNTKEARMKLLENEKQVLKEKLVFMQQAYERLEKKIAYYKNGKLN